MNSSSRPSDSNVHEYFFPSASDIRFDFLNFHLKFLYEKSRTKKEPVTNSIWHETPRYSIYKIDSEKKNEQKNSLDSVEYL